MAIALAALEGQLAHFQLEVGPHAAGELRVLELEADEEISRPFSLEATLIVPPDVALDAPSLVGADASVSNQLPDGNARYLKGIVAGVRTWDEGSGDDAHRCRLRIVPKFWCLAQGRRSRIFQQKTVPEIVSAVLNEGGVEFRDALSATYQPRDYCVQYGESDLDFISRLLEEEGIFYFFEHTDSGHVMVLGDSGGACTALPGESRILFREPSGMAELAEYVDAFNPRLELRPAAVALRDYNYLTPAVDMTATASGAGDASLEVYEFPGRYLDPGTGGTLARIRLDQERVDSDQVVGRSVSSRLSTGFLFELDEHPLGELNGKYLLVSVRHRAHQPSVLTNRDPGDTAADKYRNDFVCIRKDVPYRPPRRTPRPSIPGPQTAIVTGLAGEEIHTDEHGRIKVKFHWDRDPARDETSSCWVRVAQAWAGPGWGALYLPRIGQEVVVEFLEGDPDRPLVTGSVYNGANPPPISLPDEKTKSTLRSSSSPGDTGSNELRFEDAAGHEEVYLHAQKDLDVVVENDRTEKVGHDERLEVGNDRAVKVGANRTVIVDGNDSTTVGGDQQQEITGDRTTTVGGNHTETVTGDQSVDVGGTLVITVGQAATETIALGKVLTVGGAYAVNVVGAMNEVSATRSETVQGPRVEVVGKKKSEVIRGSRTLQVQGDVSEKVGKGRTLKVAKDFVLNVGGKLQQIVKKEYTLKAKEIVLSAEDRFFAKIGSATIELKKGGDVVIKGAKVEVKASGDVIIKASKVSEN